MWGASQRDIVLLTLSRLTPDKGHHDVIAALGQLADNERRTMLYVVAGGGKERYVRSLEEHARTADVRLRQLGQIPDWEATGAADAADLFVMVSKRTRKRLEGFGIAYIEAGARGLASVARQTGGAGEAVRNGVTGVVVPESASTTVLMRTLENLTSDAGLRSRFGAAAKAHASGFTWKAHAARVYDAFASMPERERRSA